MQAYCVHSVLCVAFAFVLVLEDISEHLIRSYINFGKQAFSSGQAENRILSIEV